VFDAMRRLSSLDLGHAAHGALGKLEVFLPYPATTGPRIELALIFSRYQRVTGLERNHKSWRPAASSGTTDPAEVEHGQPPSKG